MKIFHRIASAKFTNSSTSKIIFGSAVLLAVLFLALRPLTDPDLFWHIKTGELIWQNKIIPYNDWFSYTMSDFGWIDHEWLTEIIMFKIKDIFGWAGLSFFFAIITVLIFIFLTPSISAKPNKKNSPFFTTLVISLLGAVVASPIFGARPQIFALLGISLVFFILKKYQIAESDGQTSRIIYALPVLFLFWANMHASFAIGIGILAIFLAVDRYLGILSIRNPKADWLELYHPLSPASWIKTAYAGILSFTATFFNPYGPRIYTEIYRTFSDKYGIDVITEWLSPNFHAPEGMIFGFFVIFVFIILALIKKIDILSFVLIPLFLFLAFQSVRNIPLFVLVTMPFLIKSLSGLEKIFSEIMQKKIIALGLSCLLIFYPPYFLGIADTIKSFSSSEKQAEIGSYPKKALEFLENYPAFYQKNIFNHYAWGGYLIGNNKCQSTKQNNAKKEIRCEPKVFIDGRMAHWRTSKRHILKDYSEIFLLTDKFPSLIQEYRIKIILVEKDSFLGRALIFHPEWKKIYSDNIATVYEKKE